MNDIKPAWGDIGNEVGSSLKSISGISFFIRIPKSIRDEL